MASYATAAARNKPLLGLYCCIRWRRKSTGTDIEQNYATATLYLRSVVKLLSKRWWIPIGARLEGQKLEPEGPRAEVGFPTADQGFSSIQGTLFGFYGI